MTFPFQSVVGLDDAKLALKLAAIDPRIGGVLLRGQKGSAKTTLARGFAAFLGDAPFVELPLGATEDRVVGSIDVHAALVEGQARFQPGLLAGADGGVLYVDEINLLADHLVDVLLDVAVSGVNVVERDGISHRHPARFVLVGSMNPEEGELRPQLLDRFGLCVDVGAPTVVDERVEAVRRRLLFDREDTVADPTDTEALPIDRTSAAIDDDLMAAASRLALSVGAEGLRADLVLCRAAAANATLEGRAHAELEDLRRVAPLVLAHRSRRGPFDPPVIPPEELRGAIDSILDKSEDPSDEPDDHPGDGPAPERPFEVGAPRRPPVPPAGRDHSPRGRAVGEKPAEIAESVAVMPTVRALANRRVTDRDATLNRRDLRSNIRLDEKRRTIVLCVDLSGSMGAPERAEAASGTTLGLLGDAYERRDRVALVGFRDAGADVLLAPTSSVEVARNRLGELSTGGETPLASGLEASLSIAESATGPDSGSLIVVLTDGRATGEPKAFDRALEAASAIRRRGIPALVLDCETGATRLGLAAQLAEAMAALCVPVTDLQPQALARLISEVS